MVVWMSAAVTRVVARRRLAQLRERIAACGVRPGVGDARRRHEGLRCGRRGAGARRAGSSISARTTRRSSSPRSTALDAGMRAEVRWHFIGRLQTNKVRLVAPMSRCGRPSTADRSRRRSPSTRRHAAVLVQVNTSGEEQKGGCAPAETAGLVASLPRPRAGRERSHVRRRAAGPEDAAATRSGCSVRLADELELRERSMGMSDDLEVALKEGSTMVRVGTALFGARPSRPGAPQ